MAFVGVQFDDAVDGSLALVHRKWLTPRKREVFWPPFKQQELYYRALKRGDEPIHDKWTVYPVQRCFFECDDFDKARGKIKAAEFTSDFQSDDENSLPNKRKRAPARKLYDSDASESEVELNENLNKKKFCLPRPPPILNKESQSPSSSSCGENLSATFHCSPTALSKPVRSVVSLDPQTGPFMNISNGDKAFQNKFISHLSTVIEQNKEILSILKEVFKKQSNAFNNIQKLQIEPNVPVKLPLESFDDLQMLEEYLGDAENEQLLCAYLATLDRNSLVSSTNSALRYCITYKLAKEISYLGTRNNKKPFHNYRLKKVIVAAVKRAIPSAVERNIEDVMKNWLKRAPKNYNLEQYKKQKRQDNGI